MRTEQVTPAIETAIVTWYTRSYDRYNITVQLMRDFPAQYPEPVHIFFDNDATVQQILDREDHQPWDAQNRTPRTMALVIKRWARGNAPDCIVGMSWYI
jgi:hypothetical protein